MSETKIKRPPLSAEDPAGIIGVPLPSTSQHSVIIPQELESIYPDHASYKGLEFFNNSDPEGHETYFCIWKPFGINIFHPNMDKWIPGWGYTPRPKMDGLYLFPQNDNEEFVDDELERLDKKELTEAKERIADLEMQLVKALAGGLELGEINTEMSQKEKRFKLICAMAPAVYAEDRAVKRERGENRIDVIEISKETLRMADAILEAEGE